MFKSKTVFVVGAGASEELRLPIGSGLKDRISEAVMIDLNGAFRDATVTAAISQYQDFQRTKTSAQEHYILARSAASKITTNMLVAPSIDNFLDSKQHDEYVNILGKIGIARSILKAERSSALYDRNLDNYYIPPDDDLKKSWYIPLWQRLTMGIRDQTISEIFDNVSFVVFNYDRCLEHFLHLALMQYHDLSSTDAADLIKSANIKHVYGKVGGLPWESDVVKADFGAENPVNLLAIAQEIQTFTESSKEGTVTAVRAMISEAQTLVYLGFGYLDQNLKILTCSQSLVRRVFMTAYMMSDSELNLALQAVGTTIQKRPQQDYTMMPSANEFVALPVRGKCTDLWSAHNLRLGSHAM